MATAAERQQSIASIRELPARLEAAVMGLSEKQLDDPGGEGEWSVRQVVHHLADTHAIFLLRTKWALTEENPPVKTFSQDDWAKLPDTVSMPIEASLAILRGVQQRAAVLFSALPEEAWSRTMVHPERGPLTVGDIPGLYVRHGQAHLDQIAAVRKLHSW